MKPSDHSPPGAGPNAATGGEIRRPADPGAPLPLDVRLSAHWVWGMILAFVVLITLPGVLREFSQDRVRGVVAKVFRPEGGPVVDRLREVEKKVDEPAWAGPVRQRVQSVLHRVFREGNRKVIVGRDNWLYHRPGIRALTGRGPLLGPTHSVSQDPSLKQWAGPVPVIQDFAAQLQDRGIRLVLVPVPDKAGAGHEHLPGPAWRGGRAAESGRPVRHPDALRVAAALRGTGVGVVDLFGSLTARGPGLRDHPYLRTDTHWHPAVGPAAAAAAIGSVLGVGARPQAGPRGGEVAGEGDLERMLGVQAGAEGSGETVQAPTLPKSPSDPASPFVLLGDSFVNIFEDASLGFGDRLPGLPAWLAAWLGRPLHVIAINGGGATQVRQRFASLPDDVVRAKQVVIWVLAERDLFMDPAVARENGVEWKRVRFNPQASPPTGDAPPAGAMVVEATLRAKSEVLDMASVNYPDAVFTAEFTVDRVVSGSYAERELSVVLWNFRNRVVQPSARLMPGQKVRLTLTPWLHQGELTKINLSDDFQRFDLPLLYAEKADAMVE